MKKIFLVIFLIFLLSFNSFAEFDDNWDWAKDYFKVNDEFVEDETSTTFFSDEKKSSIEFSEDLQKELSQNNTKSSSVNANYTITPADIPFYKLSSLGYTAQYEIIKNILTGSEQNFTMLVAVLSNSSINFYICEKGQPFTYETFSNNTYSPSRFAYGYIGRTSDSFVPQFYSFNYNKSTDTFTDRTSTTQSSSTFGYNFNISGLSSNFFYCFSVYSFTLTNFISNIRDYYYFGFPPSYSSLNSSHSGTLYLNSGDNTKVFKYKNANCYAMGDARNNFPSLTVLPDSGARNYFFDSSFLVSELQIEDIRTFDDNWGASFYNDVLEFQAKVQQLINQINLSKSRITSYISTFFTNIGFGTTVPSGFYFLFVALVIISVLVGVFV